MTNAQWITVFAIFLGPISAVLITRFIDSQRERRARRMEIFRTLMRTRRAPTSQDHVGALNLIEIEFPRDEQVLDAWRELFKHFGTEHTRRTVERVKDDATPEKKREAENKFEDRLGQERQELLAKLLHTMAKALNFKVEQLEIFEGGYLPQAWVDEIAEQVGLRRILGNMLLKYGGLPVVAIDDLRQDKPDEDD